MRERARVLLVGSARPPKQKLLNIVGRLHDLDAEVRLVLYQDLPADYGDVPLDEVHALRPAAQGRGPAFRRAVRGADPEKNLWLHLKHDRWVGEHSDSATVIIALDPRSVAAVRKLARLNPHATAATCPGSVIDMTRGCGGRSASPMPPRLTRGYPTRTPLVASGAAKPSPGRP